MTTKTTKYTVATNLAEELVHPDQQLTLDELWSSMTAHFDLLDMVYNELPDLEEEEAIDIIDRAYEIARANIN